MSGFVVALKAFCMLGLVVVAGEVDEAEHDEDDDELDEDDDEDESLPRICGFVLAGRSMNMCLIAVVW